MNNERHEKALEAAVQAFYDGNEFPVGVLDRQFVTSAIAAYLQAMDAVIVPKEPSEEMVGVGLRRFYTFGKPSNGICNAYRVMIQIAPQHFTNGE